ncbi:unnamed protein product [Polarella glacialis]|uniref:Uncharacterized protein n=1 Tax=Polarella glacialis TaxID=89957 RepID=A0A813HW03_POLGL|nr:unnamed protein product [Polarella glacialis]
MLKAPRKRSIPNVSTQSCILIEATQITSCRRKLDIVNPALWIFIDERFADYEFCEPGRGLHNVDLILQGIATSNFMLLPHVRRFSSIIGLLTDLESLRPEDLLETRKAMHRSSLAAWEVTSEFYRRAARYLLASKSVGFPPSLVSLNI